jgi:hypothetical protein
MDNVNERGNPVPVRQRLGLTKSLLRELEPLDVHLDLVVPDRESAAMGDTAADFLAVGGGLRVQLKLNWEGTGQTPQTLAADDGLLGLAQRLLDASPDVDAVIVVTPPSPFPCFVVDAYAAGTSVAAPSGTVRNLPVASPFNSVREALRHLVAPPDTDWSGLPTEPIVSPSGSLSEIVDIASIAAAEAGGVRAAGRRAHGDAKQLTWQAVSGTDEEWTAELVRAALAARLDPNELSAELDQRAQAGEAP